MGREEKAREREREREKCFVGIARLETLGETTHPSTTIASYEVDVLLVSCLYVYTRGCVFLLSAEPQPRVVRLSLSFGALGR